MCDDYLESDGGVWYTYSLYFLSQVTLVTTVLRSSRIDKSFNEFNLHFDAIVYI